MSTKNAVSDPNASLRAVLGSIAAELFDAQSDLLKLQDTFGKLIEQCGQIPPDIVFELQGVDLLTQKVSDLASFLSRVSENVTDDVHLDAVNAARELKVRDLAERLCGATQRKAGDGDGEVVLFL